MRSFIKSIAIGFNVPQIMPIAYELDPRSEESLEEGLKS